MQQALAIASRLLMPVVVFVATACQSERLVLPSSSAELAGTWIGSANGMTLTMALGTAECSTTYGICSMRSPASYRLNSTGEGGSFGVALYWFPTDATHSVIANFMADTTPTAASYREQFTGSLVGGTRLVGAIAVLSTNVPPSALDTVGSSSISFTRQ
jgi:hypothetical protein